MFSLSEGFFGFICKGVETVIADDYVVDEGDVEQVAGLLEFFGLRDVCLAWERVAAGVVVEEDNPCRVAEESLLDYPSDVDDGR